MSLLGIGLVVGTFVAGFAWLILGMTNRSFVADASQSTEIEGLTSPVDIIRDRYGIPYIVADTENDAMTALGYAHAQDRLWQMDLFRRVGEGRLSELLGPKLIGYDAYARTLGFKRISERVLSSMPDRTVSTLRAYCRGVNRFIDQNKGRYPFEFDALGYEPERWEAVHCVLVMRLLAWEQNTSLWTDLLFERLRSKLDSVRYREIAPWYPSYGPTIIPGGQSPERQLDRIRNGEKPEPPNLNDTTDSVETDSSEREEELSRVLDVTSPFALIDRAFREMVGVGGSSVGSNAWAVSGDRTAGGKPMLANDPHLQHSAPCKWYQAVISIRERTLAGMTIPGMPFIVAGRNDDIAWGLTNLMADETDFYLERLKPDEDRVLHDGRWEKLEIRVDTILARDTLATPVRIRSSRHGPLVSDLARLFSYYPPPLLDTAVTKSLVVGSGLTDSTALAIRWLGRDESFELTALQRLNKARNFNEFRDAVESGGIPGLSLVYADRHGTIGYVPVLRTPVRNAARPNRVNPGWDSRFNWTGNRSVDRLPYLRNPDRGYVASANNKLSNSLPFFVGDLWVDPSRAIRLDEFLDEGNSMEAIDFVQMQGDVVAEHSRYCTEFLLRAFPDSAEQGTKVREALGLLREWNGEMAAESPEATIVAEWMQRVFHNTWEDEMGKDDLTHFLLIEQLPLKSLRRQLMTNSVWFDDVTTPEREVRDDVLRTSLGEALESLHARFDTWTLSEWEFGKIHTLTFRHPFNSIEGLRNVVNIGPVAVGGATTSLNNGEWDFNDPYDVELGPSMRQIVDFSDTTTFIRSVLSTGQSGQPMNDRYQDQTIIWHFNGYVLIDKQPPPANERLSEVRLEPAT